MGSGFRLRPLGGWLRLVVAEEGARLGWAGGGWGSPAAGAGKSRWKHGRSLSVLVYYCVVGVGRAGW